MGCISLFRPMLGALVGVAQHLPGCVGGHKNGPPSLWILPHYIRIQHPQSNKTTKHQDAWGRHGISFPAQVASHLQVSKLQRACLLKIPLPLPALCRSLYLFKISCFYLRYYYKQTSIRAPQASSVAFRPVTIARSVTLPVTRLTPTTLAATECYPVEAPATTFRAWSREPCHFPLSRYLST